MANIVIVEDDERAVNEISQFIKEISEDHNIRSFKTAEHFIKRYCKAQQLAGLTEANSAESLKLYDDEQLKLLTELDYASTPGFKGPKVSMQIEPQKFTPTKLTMTQPGSFYGLDIAKIINQENFFSTFIVSEFLEVFEKFKEQIHTEGMAKSFFPISGAPKWLAHFEVQKSGDQLSASIEDWTIKSKQMLTRNLNARAEHEAEELDMLSSIDLIIFKNGLIEIDTPTWVDQTFLQLKANKLFPENKITRFVVTKYEDDGIEKGHFFHPYIDDLITFPLDRLLFKQKIEIILNLPDKIKPSFLFSQPVEKDIEISKKTKIEKISDLGLVAPNPIPLKARLPSIFYFRFPGKKELFRIITRSSSNQKHPENPKQYHTYFDFYGVEKDIYMQVKQYLRGINEYRELVEIDEDEFEFFPENVFFSDEQKRLKTIAILDLDEQKRKQFKEAITGNMKQVRCLTDSSYYLFEKKYLQSSGEQVVPLKEHEIYDKRIVWKIDDKTFDLVEVINEPKEEDMVCGYKASRYFEGLKDWKFFFEDEKSHELIIENLNNMDSSPSTEFLFDLIHQDKTRRLANISLRKEENKIELCLTPPEPDALSGDSIDSLEAIIMDARLIPQNFNEWYTELNRRIRDKKLNVAGKDIGLIATVDPKKIKPDALARLLNLPLDTLIYKPVDTRVICYHVSRLVNCPYTKYNPSNIGWYDIKWPAYAGKKAKLVELSEFGCTTRAKKPLRVGTTVFLHDFIYKNAPGENLCARLYHCEEDPHEDGDYLCHFLYFGINDSFLKYTRSWIRENYAASKSQQG